MSTHSTSTKGHPSFAVSVVKAAETVGFWFVWITLYILFAITVAAGGIAILAVLPFSAAKSYRRMTPTNG